MSDLQLLFLVLAALYGWECACWLNRGSVACVTWFGKTWRIAHPGEFSGNQKGGFVFAAPLPPLGNILTGNQIPLSLSPQGVLTWVATSVNTNGRPQQVANFFPFTEITSVKSNNRKLLINGCPALKTSSFMFASHLAQQINHLKSLPMEQRAAAIDDLFRSGFEVKEARRLWAEFQDRTATLRWLTNGLFVYLFAFTPVAIWRFGLKGTWISLLIGLIMFTCSIAASFYRAHRKFYPMADDDRFTHTIMVLLAPATSLRAHDILSRPLLEMFHPLTLARVFCREEDFRQFAAKILRDLRHPFQPLCPSENEAWRETEALSRASLQRAAEKFLKQNKIEPEELCRPPKPTDESCRSYCPRCLAQYTTSEGECADCGGLHLVGFDESS